MKIKNYWKILIAFFALLTLISCATENANDSDGNTNNSNGNTNNSPLGRWQEVINSQGDVDTSCYYDYRSNGKVYYVSPMNYTDISVENWWNNNNIEKEEQYWYDWNDNYVSYYNNGPEESQPHLRIEGDIMTWYEIGEAGQTYDQGKYKRIK